MPKKQTLDPKEIKAAKKLSKKHLKSAKILLDESLYEDSISRSYYAVYELISALLNKEGLMVKTHKGLISNFSRLFIKTGKLPKEYSGWTIKLQSKRMNADYERRTIADKKQAKELYQKAKLMTEKLSKLLDQ